MIISKNILQGVLIGLGTISLAATHTEAAAQKGKKAPVKTHQQKDTLQVNCPKPNPGVSYRPQHTATSPVVQAINDSTGVIDKHPCITCGRG
ncbi:MAG: hypothetical protein BGO31_02245 [Bacteroidetes bacterium 43-16]|nr:MAG: hypothetical protein BGO31_02245 [Bacteroidetes bacterium 43-16]